MLDNLFDLRVFVAIAQCQSFTLAAQKLGVSRSAVGKSLSRLEHHLNTRLLHRTTRQVSLSAEGQLFYQHAIKILNQIEEAESALNTAKQYPRGRFRISLPVAFGRLHVLPILQDYLNQWPEIQAEIDFSDDYCDLVKDAFDLAIRIGGNDDSRLVRRVLAPHRLVTCASPAYLEQYGTPLQIDDLNSHRLIGFSHQELAVPWRFKVDNQDFYYPVNGPITFNNTEAITDAALCGFGICHVGAFLVGQYIADGRLIPILQQYCHVEPPICAVYPSKRYLPVKVKLFLELIERTWNKQAIWDQPRL